MPRKAFVADLRKAADNVCINHLSDLKAGDEDGTITFIFHFERTPPHASKGVKISAIVPGKVPPWIWIMYSSLIKFADVSEYPSAHMYILCTDGENVPHAINTAMLDIGDFSGAAIVQMLEKVAKALSKATSGSQANPLDLDDTDPMDVDGSDPEADFEGDDDDDDPGYTDDDWDSDPQQQSHQPSTTKRNFSNPKDRASTIALNQRIRRDLGYAKQVGFRVGHLGQLLNNGKDSFVTVSCRIAKLGISEEALQAWHLDANLYYALVIRFTSGYRTYAQLAHDESFYGENSVHVRVGLSRRYKITLSEAVDAFSKTTEKSRESNKSDAEAVEVSKEGLKPFFISRTLNELLGEKLLTLLRYRDRFAFGWDGAEE